MTTSTSSYSSPPVRPWASGRVLTSAQRDVKRRKDRIAKRAKAQKQQDNIRDIQGQITSLQDLIQTHLGSCLPSSSIGLSRKHSSVPTLSLVPDQLLPSDDDALPSVIASLAPEDPSVPSNLETTVCVRQPLDKWVDGGPSASFNLHPALNEDGSCTTLQFADGVFGTLRDVDTMDVSVIKQLNEDAIIRGVLEGWHTLRGTIYLCPLWTLLKQIDERIFMQSGILTRLSMLRMIHMMLLAVAHADSFTNLPSWYRPRPTQISFPHHMTADYFAWPCLRERLVISNCEILTDRFFKYFAYCFRLLWDYSISDTYEVDPASGMYSFSNVFIRHVEDIGRWTMCKEFFQSFPELQDDIALEVPTSAASLTPPDDGSLPVSVF